MKEKKVKIKKPLYKRWWFIALVVVVVLFVVIGIFGGDAPDEVSEPSQVEAITAQLAEFGLSDFEIHTVINLMQQAADGELLSSYTFELVDNRQAEPMDVDISIEESDADIQTVNMLEYRGLNSQNAFWMQGSDVPFSRQHLGRGTVEGREVYAVGSANHVIGRGSTTLYEVSGDTIDVVGYIEYDGEVSWNSPDRFSTLELPLYMEIGTIYEHRSELQRVYNEILGPKNVTIGEREFQNCILHRRTQVFVMPGTMSVMFFNHYYHEGFGRVLSQVTLVTISDADVTVTVHDPTYFAGEVEPSQMLTDEEIYPFIREGSPLAMQPPATTNWITARGEGFEISIPTTWTYIEDGRGALEIFGEGVGGSIRMAVWAPTVGNLDMIINEFSSQTVFSFDDGSSGYMLEGHLFESDTLVVWLHPDLWLALSLYYDGDKPLFAANEAIITTIARTLTASAGAEVSPATQTLLTEQQAEQAVWNWLDGTRFRRDTALYPSPRPDEPIMWYHGTEHFAFSLYHVYDWYTWITSILVNRETGELLAYNFGGYDPIDTWYRLGHHGW